jgi:hypothetical protein
MIKRIALIVLCSAAIAHAQLGPALHPHALEPVTFQNCDAVLSRALSLSADIHEYAYVMELYPGSKGRLDYAFPSEVTASYAARFLAGFDPKVHPNALFYFVGGTYTLRCRDTTGRYVERVGPFGASGPLHLTLASGKATIWHFFTWQAGGAQVFVITKTPLDALDGAALMARVKEFLHVRGLMLWVRNDPWFFNQEFNPLGYLFTGAYKRISYAGYRSTPIMRCDNTYGCKVSPVSR